MGRYLQRRQVVSLRMVAAIVNRDWMEGAHPGAVQGSVFVDILGKNVLGL